MEETNEPQCPTCGSLKGGRREVTTCSNSFHIIPRVSPLEKYLSEPVSIKAPEYEVAESVGLVVSKEQADQLKALVGAYGQYCSDQTENWRDGKSISFKDLWDNLDWTVDHVFEVLGLEVEQKETDKT